MKSDNANIEKAAAIIRKKAGRYAPKIALTLGSGLGAVADLMTDDVTIPYTDLPGFPQPTVAGHEGTLRIGVVGGVPAIFMKGRKHLYEGVAAGVEANKTMIRTMKAAGIETLFITNAAGGLHPDLGPGTLMAIADHINLTGTNPLAGPNDDEWGTRFPSMIDAWDKDLRGRLHDAAKKTGVKLYEGVYCGFMGPSFETPAEIRMARTIGADAVGMSTVPDNIIARHCGLRCVGIMAIVNRAAGMGFEVPSHEQTLAGAKLAEKGMAKLAGAFISAYESQ